MFKTDAEHSMDPEDLKLFKAVICTVAPALEYLKGSDHGIKELTHHVVTDALALVHTPNAKVCRGLWMGAYQHSWLMTKRGNIIDIAPVATVGGPVLVSGDLPLNPYTERKINVGSASRDYQSSVHSLAQIFRENQVDEIHKNFADRLTELLHHADSEK